MRSRIEPRKSPAERLHVEFTVLQEALVDAGNLKFPPGRRLYLRSDLQHLVRVEIQAYDRVVALRMSRLFLDAEALAFRGEFGYAISLRFVHPVAKDGSALPLFRCLDRSKQLGGQVAAVEDVIPEDKADRVVSDELFPDYECLGKSVGRRLFGIAEVYPKGSPIPEQPPEGRQVLRRGNNQYIPDSRKHKHAHRVINHWFVVYRQQLLGNPFRDRIKAGSAASCEYNAFHKSAVVLSFQI